jgi:hypothetical protein
MPTVHSVGFTPPIACQVIVTANATVFSRHGSGISGNFSLALNQAGQALQASDVTVLGARDQQSMIKRFIFNVVGGQFAIASLEVTRPGVGGYSFSDIEITVEQVLR